MIQGPIAVHCRAGLGRTGTIIGIWLMENYGLTAKEGICWMRLCRPGMVMQCQANYLVSPQAPRIYFNPKNRSSSSAQRETGPHPPGPHQGSWGNLVMGISTGASQRTESHMSVKPALTGDKNASPEPASQDLLDKTLQFLPKSPYPNGQSVIT